MSKEKPLGLNFVDPDGERWVDKYGFVVWGAKGPTSFATDIQKELGITMRKSKTGKEQLQKLIDAPFDVYVNIDAHSLTSILGKVIYRSNNPIFEKRDIEIKIYQKSARRRASGTSNKISEMEAMAINFGHEIEHLTENAFILDARGASENEREEAPDKISENMLMDYLNKLERIEPLFLPATTEMQQKQLYYER